MHTHNWIFAITPYLSFLVTLQNQKQAAKYLQGNHVYNIEQSSVSQTMTYKIDTFDYLAWNLAVIG